MEPIIEEFTISLKYQVSVNTETGEMTTKCIKRTIDKSNFEVVEIAPKKSKKIKKEESSTPQLILEDNKYILNNAAIELMQISAEDKIDIKYEKKGKGMIPVIGSDSVFGTKGGNKLSKSNTVACRGSKNTELAKHGSVFEIIPHDSKPGLFFLKGDIIEDSTEDEINIDDINEDLPLDSDIEELIDDKEDANITEIDSNFFVL